MSIKRAQPVLTGKPICGGNQRTAVTQIRDAGWKIFLAALAGTIVLLFAGSSAFAQDRAITVILRQGQSDAEIGRVVGAAAQTGRPVAIEWQDAKEATAPESEAAASTVDITEGFEPLDGVSRAFVRGARLALNGLLGIAGVFADTESALVDEGRGGFTVAGIAVLAIMSGMFGASLFRRIVPGKFYPHDDRLALPGRMKAAIARFALDLVSVGILIAVARIFLHFSLEGGTLSLQIAAGLVTIATVTALYATCGRIFLAPLPDGKPLVEITRPRWHLALLITYGAIGSPCWKIRSLGPSFWCLSKCKEFKPSRKHRWSSVSSSHLAPAIRAS
ncbi:hypothetical protein G6L33_22900 [Agrobacterium rhizogenes]|nr:hypothetical protein [Rhizobium rhizogenes]NTH66711.1 hypothetical protein [Rhizobium rhizogenes]